MFVGGTLQWRMRISEVDIQMKSVGDGFVSAISLPLS
jgi:hypothetical protein